MKKKAPKKTAKKKQTTKKQKLGNHAKYERGGRVEAYTFGEALKEKNWEHHQERW